MKKKTWVAIWFLLLFILFISSFIFIYYLNECKGVPLRLTSSISFDAKLEFLKDYSEIKHTEILIVGSSMGLNNINSELLAKNIRNENILNISSWGLKVDEIYKLIKILDLKNVKKIIYINQYFDFYGNNVVKYNEVDFIDYLYKDLLVKPYLKTFKTLNNNYKDYLEWEKRYLNDLKYSSLLFNQFGDVLLNINKDNSNINRWKAITKVKSIENNYSHLEELIIYAQSINVELYLITTPYRLQFFENNEFLKHYNEYIQKILELSNKYNVRYLNLQDRLNLIDEYFADSSHLNYKGSNLVSLELAKYLNTSK